MILFLLGALTRHVNSVHLRTGKIKECPICGYTTESLLNLVRTRNNSSNNFSNNQYTKFFSELPPEPDPPPGHRDRLRQAEQLHQGRASREAAKGKLWKPILGVFEKLFGILESFGKYIFKFVSRNTSNIIPFPGQQRPPAAVGPSPANRILVVPAADGGVLGDVGHGGRVLVVLVGAEAPGGDVHPHQLQAGRLRRPRRRPRRPVQPHAAAGTVLLWRIKSIKATVIFYIFSAF